jgi:hypothetical protein
MVYFDFVKIKKPVNNLIYRLLKFFDFAYCRGDKI